MAKQGLNQATLDLILDEAKKALDPRGTMSEDEFFEFFTARLVLTSDLGLSDDALRQGLVDGSKDRGIDGIYGLLNDKLIVTGRESTDSPEPVVTLIVLQIKRSVGFGQQALSEVELRLPPLLDLERLDGADEDLLKQYNPRIIERTRAFVRVLHGHALTKPKVRIRFIYVSRGDEVHHNLNDEARQLEDILSKCLRRTSATVEFVGVEELLALFERRKQHVRALVAAQPVMYEDDEEEEDDVGRGYLCLVRLHDYAAFLSDDHGHLNKDMFESNVRDHLGRTDVNTSIRDTLLDLPTDREFWWFNNGITILATDVIPATRRKLLLTDPQVVNGLQTSNEIHAFLRDHPGHSSGDRRLLVRVIKATDDVRDEIITATNHQNKLPRSALRATERVQKNLEYQLVSRGWYYERRKNSHSNHDRPVDKVVSMAHMAACVASVLLQRPDLARKGGEELFQGKLYDQLFSDLYGPSVFINSLLLVGKAKAAVAEERGKYLEDAQEDDFAFHLATIAAVMLARKRAPQPTDIAKLNLGDLPHSSMKELLPVVAIVYRQARGTNAVPLFELAQTEKPVRRMLERANSLLSSGHWRDWPSQSVPLEFALQAGEARLFR